MPADMSCPPEPHVPDAQRAGTARADLIGALRRERAGYLTHGKTDRARQVGDQLAALGSPVQDTAESAPRERAVPPGPKSRRGG